MAIRSISLLFILITLQACKVEPTSPTILWPDEELKKELVGKWVIESGYSSATYARIEYRSDGTFSSLYHSEFGVDSFDINAQGQFSVQDGYVICSQVHHAATSASHFWRGIILTHFAVLPAIHADTMWQQDYDRFSLVSGSPDQLWGVWDVTCEQLIPGGDTTKFFYEGVTRRRYRFFNTPPHYSQTVEYLDDPFLAPSTYERGITYTPPYLYEDGFPLWPTTVEFRSGHMLWSYLGPNKFIRVHQSAP
jgi:hypothetical protein